MQSVCKTKLQTSKRVWSWWLNFFFYTILKCVFLCSPAYCFSPDGPPAGFSLCRQLRLFLSLWDCEFEAWVVQYEHLVPIICVLGEPPTLQVICLFTKPDNKPFMWFKYVGAGKHLKHASPWLRNSRDFKELCYLNVFDHYVYGLLYWQIIKYLWCVKPPHNSHCDNLIHGVCI